MSRIGRLPVPVPAGVDVTINGQDITVKGPKGTLHVPSASRSLSPALKTAPLSSPAPTTSVPLALCTA